MHHLRKLRNLKGFNKILGAINRKQIPVCKNCHTKIHQGLYDGISLKNLYKEKRNLRM